MHKRQHTCFPKSPVSALNPLRTSRQSQKPAVIRMKFSNTLITVVVAAISFGAHAAPTVNLAAESVELSARCMCKPSGNGEFLCSGSGCVWRQKLTYGAYIRYQNVTKILTELLLLFYLLSLSNKTDTKYTETWISVEVGNVHEDVNPGRNGATLGMIAHICVWIKCYSTFYKFFQVPILIWRFESPGFKVSVTA